MDIRIVTEYHVQPVLFGPPKVFETYRLVDWNTDQPVSEKRYKSLPDAERAMCELVYPHVSKMAEQWANREVAAWQN